MKAFCSECKCCEAQDGFELCIFCEDGVPCPNRQRAARPVATPAPSAPLVSTIAKARKPRNPNHPWRGIAGLHLSDNAPAKPAPVEVLTAGKDLQEEKERTNMATKLCACGCGTELKPDSVWDYVKGHKTQPEKKKRLCGCGCGAPLVNRHPYIKGHNPDATKGPKKANVRKPQPTPPRNSSSKIEAPETGAATLHVTETHLNNFLLKLSLDEKTSIVQRHLEGA